MSSDTDTIIYLINVAIDLIEIFGLFIMIVSTIGNLCNCFVFLRISPLNKHPNALFVIGSSIGSFIFINISLIQPLVQVLTGIVVPNTSLFFCKIYKWLPYSAGCFSFMCYCFAAFGQFLITLPKIRWQRLITRIRAQLMILFTAIIWLLIFIPLLIYSNHVQTSSTTFVCTISDPIINTYASYWIIIGYYFLPILLILILFCLTWYNLRQLLRRRRSLEGSVTRMMLIQMSVILVSGIPAATDVIYTLATANSSKTEIRGLIEFIVQTALIFFTYLTNGISFWIFLFASKAFRKHLKDFISKSKLFKIRIRPISMPATRTNVPK